MARKRNKKPTSLDERLELRMTPLERRTFQEAADRFGISLSLWLRLAAWRTIKDHKGTVTLYEIET